MVSPVIYFDCCKTIINPEKPGKLTVRDENAPLECRSKKKNNNKGRDWYLCSSREQTCTPDAIIVLLITTSLSSVYILGTIKRG